MADFINKYATSKNYYFQFYSVVSGETVQFPALLTQLDDSFSSTWASQNVFGRQDPIMTFQNIQRSIDIGFTVPSHDSEQAEDNLIKLNQLIKYLYPAFAERGTANSISAAPLFRIKFANLIYDASSNSPGGDAQESGLVCAIGNFKHAFSFDGSSGWLDKVGKAIPSTFSISFNATILHTHDLGRINRQYPNQGDEQFPYRVDLSERRRRLEEEFDARADAALKLADSQPTLDELIANRPRANTGTITEGNGE